MPEDLKYQRRDDVDPAAHYVEESVAVYLMRDPAGADRWVIDPTALDGWGLDSTYDSYPSNTECECQDKSDCDKTADRMGAEVGTPSGEELMFMLADALGYTITKEE